jgi:pimeloyl-ACP methyl ester carboxylesterase
MPLASEADVILYALRGHGRSQVAPSGYNVVDHVADLVALLDALDVDAPVHLVGCSYGGAVATVTAMEHPDRVASLFLVDPLFSSPDWISRVLPAMEAAAAMVDRDYTIDEVMVALGGLVTRRKAGLVAERAQRLLVGTTILDDLRNEPELGADDYARIRCPVGAVYGTASEMLPLADMLRSYVPSVDMHTIDGADHLGIFGRTKELDSLIRGHVLVQHTARVPG